jgi:iron complex outermembrane receptor protein
MGYSHAISLRTLLQVELFRSDLSDAIESVYVTDPGGTNSATEVCPNSKINGFCSQMVNIGSEVHEGVEFKVRSMPFSRLTLDASYSYINRTIAYNFASSPAVSQINTSIIVLPTLPRNKLVGTASFRFPHQVLGLISARYEGGLTLQDTTYSSKSPLFLPFSESFGTLDIGTIIPVYKRATVQAGIKNLLDRNYYYTAGYPEEGRNWFVNLRYQF